jgi:tellurite methyltransferase
LNLEQTTKGKGQYDLEYSKCECFWGTDPGKLVRMIPEYLKGGVALDLGAGECKNSVFLSKNGFVVDAVEISELALRNYERITSPKAEPNNKLITTYNSDALLFENNIQYDLVIAYGLLHCLSSIEEVDLIISKMKKWTKLNGIIIVVSFTDMLKVPFAQAYLDATLLPVGYLFNAFSEFDVLQYEEDVISETHPTSNIEHQHSLTRLMVRKIKN